MTQNKLTQEEQRFLNTRFSQNAGSEQLRHLLKLEDFVFAPGLYNPGGVKMSAYAGFKAAYLSGFSYAVEEHGTTDVGAFSRTDLVTQASRMVRAAEYWQKEQYIETGTMVDPIPLVMDMEDGHGGFGQVQFMTRELVKAGVAAGHLEDQTERRCGHLPGKVLVSKEKHIERLKAARATADEAGNPDFVLIARTDAAKAKYTPEGVEGSLDLAISRTIAYADAKLNGKRVIDLAWCEFPNQDISAMEYWANGVRKVHPDLNLAINLSSSFDWTNESFEKFTMNDLAKLGYKYQFMTLADFHAGRNGSWKFFKNIQTYGTEAFGPMQVAEKESGTPSISHNKMGGTKMYFVGGTLFGNETFVSESIKAKDADISEE